MQWCAADLELSLSLVTPRQQDMSKEDSLKEVVEFVRDNSGQVSVTDIAEALEFSRSYVRELAVEALERGLIDGSKSKPVIGYVFEYDEAYESGDDADMEVATTRSALLYLVKEYSPSDLSRAKTMELEELRDFVRKHVADGTTVVNRAWRFS